MVGRPSDGEVLRNRIIAIAILVMVVIVLVNLVMCAARGIGGSGEESSSSSSANAAASEQAPSANAAVGSGEGVEDPWVESGRFSTGDAELDQLNPGVRVYRTSAKTGDGIDAWAAFLGEQIEAARAAAGKAE